MSNKQVVKAWAEGKIGKSNRMLSDGKTLYSYALPIGVTLEDGRKAVIRYQASRMYSMTTSKHVGIAMREADVIVDPPARGNIWGPVAAATWARLAIDKGWTLGLFEERWKDEKRIANGVGLELTYSNVLGACYRLKDGANEL